MIAFMTDRRGNTIALTQDEKGYLRWQSESPSLQEDADRFVPLNAIPPSGGLPAAWAIRKLEEFTGGQGAVCASNIAPIDRNFGIPPRPDKARYSKEGADLWADADTPERYAAVKGDGSKVKIRLYAYKSNDEESSLPLCTRDEWEDFARWAAEQGGELKRLAVEGHTDAYNKDGTTVLYNQLVKIEIPEKYSAITDALTGQAEKDDIEGLLISLDLTQEE
jgi:hypothetical protein